MAIDITVKIGGEAGQGIQTVGQLLALTCQKAGLYVFAINDFESRIRGGHSFFQIRISDRQVRAPHHQVHLLICLNRQTLELHRDEVVPQGLVMMATKDAVAEQGVLSIPVFDLAQKAGSSITANTVAAGSCLALLGAPLELFSDIISRQFIGKSADVVQQNIVAARLGYQAVAGEQFSGAFNWDGGEPKGMFIEGAQSIALGALAGDCRCAAFYPMSPATGIMAHLAAVADTFPLVVEQAEDEIAAANMIIGSSFAGVRSMTATSGGGFCLMVEALGLAGMTETPVVIINAQRPGPATGLPTRTAQGDLQFVIRASQDEFPRFVFAPGSPEDAYETTARAFQLSEKYQVPAIILVDQYFNDSLYITEKEFMVPDRVERFIEDAGDTVSYKRYVLTPTGVSPRALPCRGKALVAANGNEHSEDGHTTEANTERTTMVNKRNAKIPHMLAELRPPYAYHGHAGNILVGWGSTAGVIREAVDVLRTDGADCGALHFTDLWPFPGEAAKRALDKASRFFMVEQNASGQLGQLIRQETLLSPAGMVLKYDGRPFYANEIVNAIKAYMR
ncbi:MAG: 2-oxoacid:acceptor oxidoreductase subunit alpha [Proteobacteria bacterium]|nr:2-oxoacid:acceptor oxidoreductase subunit alpha [Pseudomonadota bacterium]